MEIENLTLKQIREIQSLLVNQAPSQSILDSSIGKYAIVRTRNEGINAGFIVKADETGCVIKDARRIWYHKPKDQKTAWYEGVSKTGLSQDSKVSCAVIEKYIIEDYSLTICSDIAKDSIINHPSHES